MEREEAKINLELDGKTLTAEEERQKSAQEKRACRSTSVTCFSVKLLTDGRALVCLSLQQKTTHRHTQTNLHPAPTLLFISKSQNTDTGTVLHSSSPLCYDSAL